MNLGSTVAPSNEGRHTFAQEDLSCPKPVVTLPKDKVFRNLLVFLRGPQQLFAQLCIQVHKLKRVGEIAPFVTVYGSADKDFAIAVVPHDIPFERLYEVQAVLVSVSQHVKVISQVAPQEYLSDTQLWEQSTVFQLSRTPDARIPKFASPNLLTGLAAGLLHDKRIDAQVFVLVGSDATVLEPYLCMGVSNMQAPANPLYL
eukprot:ANDGO_00769.mRNA.1 hypothetical protein